MTNVYSGWNSDLFAVTLADLVLESPTLSGDVSPLLSANNQMVYGVGGVVPYILQFDAAWQRRSAATPAIGPREPLSAGSAYPPGPGSGGAVDLTGLELALN